MAIAIQWHIAHNSADKIIAATSLTSEAHRSRALKDGMIVACQCWRGEAEDTRSASKLARAIEAAYSASANKSPAKSTAERLSDAVTQGLRRIGQNGHTTSASSDVIAVAVQSNQLSVARWGRGEVFLLRAGALEHLTVDDAFGDPFAFIDGITGSIEPELGEMELKGEDRVLLCTGSVAEALQPTQLQHLLRSQPSSRRTAQAILQAAESTRDSERDGEAVRALAVAVIDCVSNKYGAFPTKQLMLVGPLGRPIIHMGPMPILRRRAWPFAALATAMLVGATVIALSAGSTSRAAAPASRPTSVVSTPMPVSPVSAPGVRLNTPQSTVLARVTQMPAPTTAQADVTTTPQATITPMPTAHLNLNLNIEIEPRTTTLTLGESVLLRAVVADPNGAIIRSGPVRWSPANLVTRNDASTVLFHASSAGTFTVTAYFGDTRSNATIFVLVPLVPPEPTETATPTLQPTPAPATTIESPTTLPQPTPQPTDATVELN